MRIILFLLLFIYISNCSLNTNSEIWNYNKKKIKLTNTDLFGNDLEFDEYKEELFRYTQNSDYPDINN